MTTTPNTTASSADDDSLLLCVSDLQHSTIYDNAREMVDCVRAVAERITALAASTPPVSITLDFKQATELLGMYGGEPTEVTLMVGNGHSGKGVYAHWTSVPEEEAMFLGASNDEAASVAPTQPDWRELCRRLYAELFHCDKQMTCTLNEMGDPMWRTGAEVRDVLSDAKAALEASPTTPEAAPVAPAPQPASGPVGFDHKTAANFLNGKTVTDEEMRRFIACSRWAHDDRDGLRNTIADLRREIAQRDAEIALLKTSLLDAESPTQAAQQGEYPATGNPEADHVLGRLNSSDPGFDDCADAAALIHKLVSEIKGPDGFATWKDAAIAARAQAAQPEGGAA